MTDAAQAQGQLELGEISDAEPARDRLDLGNGWLADLISEAIENGWCLVNPCSTCGAQRFRSELTIRAVRAAGHSMSEIDGVDTNHPLLSDFGPTDRHSRERELEPKVFRIWAAAVQNLSIELSELPAPVSHCAEAFEAVSLAIAEMELCDLSSLGRLDHYVSGSWASGQLSALRNFATNPRHMRSEFWGIESDHD